VDLRRRGGNRGFSRRVGYARLLFDFQWEVSLTVIAALLTLVGFSVNDTIVVFDRIRENRRLHRRESLYKITNDSINQTSLAPLLLQVWFFLSVLSMVLFGRGSAAGFSLALLIGITFGRIHRLLSRARSWFGGNAPGSRDRPRDGGESVRTKHDRARDSNR